MNDMVMDTASGIGVWFGNMGSKIHRAFIRSGRARAAAELTRLGYHQAAQNLIDENRLEN